MSAPPIRPLPARSVLLSVLLGSHPPQLPVRVLVRTAGVFGIAGGTARVALSRLGADGEVVSDGGTYGLSERHLARQRGQDAALRPPTRAWEGRWELLSAGDGGGGGQSDHGAGGGQSDRGDGGGGGGGQSDHGAGAGGSGAAGGAGATVAALAAVAADRRMARLRPGLWTRPDNLSGPFPDLPPGATLWVASVAAGDPAPSGDLWDLPGWSAAATGLMAVLESAAAPAERLAVAAAMVRHIRTDPLLPDELLPAGWPGPHLRQVYDAYRGEMGRLIGGLRDGD